jgi:hypothetical protein
MGTLAVEKSTLQAMMLEILLKDKAFFRDILREIIKKDPNCLDEFTSMSDTMLMENVTIVTNEYQNSENIGEAEARNSAKNQFEKYSTVFKALA